MGGPQSFATAAPSAIAPSPMPPEDGTLPSLLRDRRDRMGKDVAFFQKRGGSWHASTWDDYARQVACLSRALLDHGLQKGDHVAIIGDVSQEWVIAFMATA